MNSNELKVLAMDYIDNVLTIKFKERLEYDYSDEILTEKKEQLQKEIKHSEHYINEINHNINYLTTEIEYLQNYQYPKAIRNESILVEIKNVLNEEQYDYIVKHDYPNFYQIIQNSGSIVLSNAKMRKYLDLRDRGLGIKELKTLRREHKYRLRNLIAKRDSEHITIMNSKSSISNKRKQIEELNNLDVNAVITYELNKHVAYEKNMLESKFIDWCHRCNSFILKTVPSTSITNIHTVEHEHILGGSQTYCDIVLDDITLTDIVYTTTI